MSNLQVFANNAQAELINPVSPIDTIITIGLGEIARFPAVLTGGRFYLVTLSDNTLLNDQLESVWEIVKVTAVSNAGANLNLTVERAQEGGAALAWTAGQLASIRTTAGSLDAANAEPNFDNILTDGNDVLVDSNGLVLYSC